jgi:xanthine dehydrogenase YagT iron-sulfur-binding subunit
MASDDKKARPGVGFTRRDFLQGSAAGALAEAASGALVGPDALPMSFRINGEAYTARLEPRVTLLDALRNHLGLTGAKKVCDRTTCGACTVILDGRPVYACSMLAIEAQGRDIQTIEGLGTPDGLHPLQAAFVENDAQQCGFCTPGFVMACKAFVDAHPNPTEEQINEGAAGPTWAYERRSRRPRERGCEPCLTTPGLHRRTGISSAPVSRASTVPSRSAEPRSTPPT